MAASQSGTTNWHWFDVYNLVATIILLQLTPIPTKKMAELDEILKKYTDQTTGSLHGATFVTVDGKGWFTNLIISYLARLSQCTSSHSPLTPIILVEVTKPTPNPSVAAQSIDLNP